MSFAGEIISGNIGHVKNGREPNASAAIFPIIPFGSLFIVLITFLLNKIYDDLGFYLVVGLFVIYCPIWYVPYMKSKKELESMIKNQSQK